MAEHTQGKLTFNGYGNAPQWFTLDTEDLCIVQGVIREADARRLVACWNALLGVPIEDIETGLIVMKVTDCEAALKESPDASARGRLGLPAG